MDTFKGSLEPVRGSKLSVKVGKDMTTDEVCVLAQENDSDYDQFFSGSENYVPLYPDSKLVYHIPDTDEPFNVAKYKTELDKPFSKISFYLCKDEKYRSGLLKGFADSVSQIYLFLRCTSCLYVR